MRYLYCLCILLFGASTAARAQDVIVRTTGEELTGKVLTIKPEKIAYVLPAAPTDTLYLNTPEVFMIRYANGTKEMIRTITYVAAPGLTLEQATLQGQRDADRYFKAPGAFWGTFGATVVSSPVYWLGGVAVGAGIAASAPKAHNLMVPDQAMLQNTAYMNSYTKEAQRKKLRKAAAGFGVGVGASVVAIVVLLFVAISNFQ